MQTTMHGLGGRFGAIAAALLLMAAATPALASFGAVAYDQSTGKYGASFNQSTQSQAFERALRQCASPQCRVHPVEPAGCGALALSDTDKAGHIYWGGADRQALDQAKRDALLHCQTHTKTGNCTVRISGCNK